MGEQGEAKSGACLWGPARPGDCNYEAVVWLLGKHGT